MQAAVWATAWEGKENITKPQMARGQHLARARMIQIANFGPKTKKTHGSVSRWGQSAMKTDTDREEER